MAQDIISATVTAVMPFLAPVVFVISAGRVAELLTNYVTTAAKMGGSSGRRNY